METNALKIGQVARGAGVGIDTVRYYERRGLVAEPPRRESGYRAYPPEAIPRVRFIKRAQELGFTLKEIGELLSLQLNPSSTCGDVRRRAKTKLSDIQSKIDTLERMKTALADLVNECNRDGSTGECPILQALDQPE